MQKTKHDMPAFLLAKALTVNFGFKEALQDITLPVAKGDILALIGPSGSGKTVLLQSFNRLNELDGATTGGKVTLDGQNIYAPGLRVEQLRERVGMVFKNPSLFHMSIYHNVSYGPRLSGDKTRAELDEIVESALRVVGLWDSVKNRLRRAPDGLNAGQRQRLCIARTLATQPDVLLLDEPTVNLGPGNGMLIEDLLYQLSDGGMTVLFATHDMQQAARLSDTCAFLLDGRLVEHSPTRDMFSHPYDERTGRYISGQLLA